MGVVQGTNFRLSWTDGPIKSFAGSVLQMGIPTGFPVHCLTQDNQIYLSTTGWSQPYSAIRPSASLAIDSEPSRAGGIIVN